MIQLMVRKPLGELNNLPDQKGDKKKEEELKVEVKEEKVKVAEVAESKVYKVGDGLDVRDRETGIEKYNNELDISFFDLSLNLGAPKINHCLNCRS